jgi:hypothetical protein
MTETITTLSRKHADLEPLRQVRFPDGAVFWICPRRGGYDSTREQATVSDQQQRPDIPSGPVVFENETRRIELRSFKRQRRPRSHLGRDLSEEE